MFVVWVKVGEKELFGVVNIGNKFIFNGICVLLEVYLFDFV